MLFKENLFLERRVSLVSRLSLEKRSDDLWLNKATEDNIRLVLRDESFCTVLFAVNVFERDLWCWHVLRIVLNTISQDTVSPSSTKVKLMTSFLTETVGNCPK